ncbi:hypothetical protein AX17_004309 [Amanita inopinata Kibby_2008]|nr:hypothetical protein AX17_004309 [Amanita inopinata Kibby_2008]
MRSFKLSLYAATLCAVLTTAAPILGNVPADDLEIFSLTGPIPSGVDDFPPTVTPPPVPANLQGNQFIGRDGLGIGLLNAPSQVSENAHAVAAKVIETANAHATELIVSDAHFHASQQIEDTHTIAVNVNDYLQNGASAVITAAHAQATEINEHGRPSELYKNFYPFVTQLHVPEEASHVIDAARVQYTNLYLDKHVDRVINNAQDAVTLYFTADRAAATGFAGDLPLEATQVLNGALPNVTPTVGNVPAQVTQAPGSVQQTVSPIVSNAPAQATQAPGSMQQSASPVVSNAQAQATQVRGNVEQSASPVVNNAHAQETHVRGDVKQTVSPVVGNAHGSATHVRGDVKQTVSPAVGNAHAQATHIHDNVKQTVSPAVGNAHAQATQVHGDVKQTVSPVVSNAHAQATQVSDNVQTQSVTHSESVRTVSSSLTTTRTRLTSIQEQMTQLSSQPNVSAESVKTRLETTQATLRETIAHIKTINADHTSTNGITGQTPVSDIAKLYINDMTITLTITGMGVNMLGHGNQLDMIMPSVTNIGTLLAELTTVMIPINGFIPAATPLAANLVPTMSALKYTEVLSLLHLS